MAETVAWTNENNCAHLLRDLCDADFNWVEEPMAGAVGPRHEPQAASLSVNVVEPHASGPAVDQAPDDETEGVDADEVAERCAFCDRRNKPMAGDTCDHFIGMIFDGGMIEPPLCALISAWRHLVAERAHESPRSVLLVLGKQLGISAETIDAFRASRSGLEDDLSDEEMLDELMEPLKLSQGEFATQDQGMLIGSRCSIYCADPRRLEGLVRDLTLLANAIAS